MQTVRAFISSTWIDLQEEREAVERILHRLRQTRFVGMEYFGSRDDDNRATSLAELDRCDVYIGILGHRYGSGLAEAEYRRARERHVPCLIYVKDGFPSDTPPDQRDDARRRRDWESALRAQHAVSAFSTPFDLAAKVAADLHNFLFDRYLVEGIDTVGALYAERIQNFLSEYTGTADKPVPFGGREDYLAILNGWLAGVDRVRLLMLAAPAGRGKSALLVQWSRMLAAREDLAVVFFPVSIRFNTNLAQVVFPTLAARLAALHGEILQVRPDASVEMWRGLVANYLARPLPEGRRLVLILDGIDEAADWEATPDLFPYALASGAGIVVSARYVAGDTDGTNWLRRLGWDRPGDAFALSLDPLTHAGVADVLSHLGVTANTLSTRVDVVAELHRLSEGDPLLVRLYVTALVSDSHAIARLAPEDLRQIKPGLEGFFARWWDDQRRLWGTRTPLREPAVQTLLNLLACALGPLRQDDLLQLCPPDSGLSTWTLEEALAPIKRFVVGDGSIQGYAFSHPRLGSYFYERLQRAGEARKHEARYHEWGTTTLNALGAGTLRPAAVSHYLIQYLMTHFERAQTEVGILRTLVSAEWRDAWSVLDQGSFTGFLGDVRRVWRAAEQADAVAARNSSQAPYLDVEIRCALCASSVSSIAEEIPAALLVALVKQQVWTPAQGLAYASNIADDAMRVDTLLDLAQAGPLANRDQLLGAAIAAARGATDPDERDVLLARVAQNLSEPLAALRHIPDPTRRLEYILTLMPGDGHDWKQHDILIDAAAAARTLTEPLLRIQALSHLSRLLSEPHRAQAVEAISGDLGLWLGSAASSDHLPVLACCLPEELLRITASRLITLGWIREHVEMFERTGVDRLGRGADVVIRVALDAIRSSGDDERRDLLAAMARVVPPHLSAKVLAAANDAADPAQRTDILLTVALHLRADDRQRAGTLALASIRDIADPATRANLLTRMVRDLPDGLPAEAVAATADISDAVRRVKLLQLMLPVVSANDRATVVAALLHTLQSSTRPNHVALWFSVVPDVVDAVQDDALIECIDRFDSVADRITLLRRLAEKLQSTRRERVLGRALAALPDLTPEVAIGDNLVVLAPLLDDRLLSRAFLIALRVRDRRARLRACRSVLRQASPAALDPFMRPAFEAVVAIADPRVRAELLCDIAWHLVADDAAAAFAASLAAVDAIEVEPDRSATLLRVACALPDEWIPRALDAARRLPTPIVRIRALTELAAYVNEIHATGALVDAVATAEQIVDSPLRARVARALRLVLIEAAYGPDGVNSVLYRACDRCDELAAAVDRRDRLTADSSAEIHAARDQMVQPGSELPVVDRALLAARCLDEEDAKAEALGIIAAVAPIAADEILVTAFDVMATIPSSRRRNAALRTMLERMPLSCFDAALTAIGTIEDLQERIDALMALGRTPYVEHKNTARAEALRQLRESKDPRRFALLLDIAHSLPDAVASDAFELAAAATEADDRARLLAIFARKVLEDRRAAALRQALTAVQEASLRVRDFQIIFLAEDLPPSLFTEALQTIVDAFDNNERSLQWVISTLRMIGQWSADPSKREQAFAAALEVIKRIAEPSERIEELFKLEALLAEVGREQALSEALRVAADLSQQAAAIDPALRAWREIVDRLLQLTDVPARVIGSAVGTALRLEAGARANTLHTLAQRLPKSLLPGALVAAAAIDSPLESIAAIDVLLGAHKRDPGWSEILDATRTIKDESQRARTTAHLARHVGVEQIRQVLDALRTVRDAPTRARALVDVAELLTGPLEHEALIEAWRAVRGLDIELNLIDRLVQRSTRGDRDETVLSEAVATALGMAVKALRVTAVSKLAPHLPAGLLRQALAGLQKVRDEAQRAAILTALAASLEDQRERSQLLTAATHVARHIFWPEQRARALAGLADHLSGRDRDAVLADALAAVRQTGDSLRAEALSAVATRLADGSESLMSDALDIVATMKSPDAVFAPLFPNVAPTFLPRLFEISRGRYANAIDRIRMLEFDPRPTGVVADAVMGIRERERRDRRQGPAASAHVSVRLTGPPWIYEEPDEAFRELVVHLGAAGLQLPRAVVERYRRSATAAAMVASLYSGSARDELLALAFERLARTWPPEMVPTMLVDVSREFPPALLARMLHALPFMQNESIRADVLRRMTVLLEPSQLPDCVPLLLSITDDEERHETMARLLPLLPAGSVPGLAARARAIADVSERALALKVVALRGGVHAERVLQEALDLVPTVSTASARGALLCSLVEDLPDRLLPMALRSLRGLNDQPSVAEALTLLIPGLQEEHFDEALAVLDRFTDDVQRVLVLRRLAHAGPVAVLAEALSRVSNVRNPFYRAQIIEAFALRQSPALVPPSLSMAAAIVNSGARARTIAAIASGSTTPIPENLLVDAVNRLTDVVDESYRVTLLARLVPTAPGSLVAPALQVLEGIEDEHLQVDGLRVLLPYLDERSSEAAAGAVSRLHDDHHRAVLYGELSERAGASGNRRLIEMAATTVEAIRSRLERAEAWREIVHRMVSPDPRIVARALTAAFDVARPLYTVDVIVTLAPAMTESLRDQALQRAQTIQSEGDRVRALVALAPHSTLTQFEAVLKAGAALLGEVARLDFFSGIAPCVPELLWPAVLRLAVDTLRETYRSEALVEFAPHVPEGLMVEAIAAATRLSTAQLRLNALVGLGPFLPPALATVALDVIGGFIQESDRCEALEALGPRLFGPDLERAIGQARLLSNPVPRARALCALALRRDCDNDLLSEVIDALGGIEDDERRSEAICRLPSGLPPQLRARARTAAAGIEDAAWREDAEEHLEVVRTCEWEPLFAPVLDSKFRRIRQEPSHPPQLSATSPHARRLAAVAGMEAERDRVVTLRELAPVLTEAQHSSALELVADFTAESNQAEALNALLVELPPSLLPNVWTIARRIRDDAARLSVLKGMALKLARQSGGPLHIMWSDILQFLSRRHRAHLLDAVHALLPVVEVLGGHRVLRETPVSIQDVGTWWP
jgi:hypothetical protein